MVRWHLGKEPLHTTESAIMVPFIVDDMRMSYNFYLLSAVCGESSGWRCPWGSRKSSRSRRKDNSHQKPSSSPRINCPNYTISFTSDSITNIQSWILFTMFSPDIEAFGINIVIIIMDLMVVNASLAVAYNHPISSRWQLARDVRSTTQCQKQLLYLASHTS